MYSENDNICALATPQGSGAIGIVRLSGKDAIEIADSIFSGSLADAPTHTLKFGNIMDGKEVVDEAVVAVFRAPGSYTGENSAEIYCHASSYIEQKIIMLLVSKGARMAEAGEFSKRAFLNGKLDLAQAEAVADLISSQTEAAHRVAMQQMRGGFSKELKEMRGKLLELVSLMELELDFSEEEVEFANRSQLKELLESVYGKVEKLIDSFALGNVIKNGVPVAIVGATNTGKSTLLNYLLGEEKAIVSNIHGTTRDVIEDCVNMGGMTFRFIDTAGIRETKEAIEVIGIERTFTKLKQASVVILVLDALRPEHFSSAMESIAGRIDPSKQKLIITINKIDKAEQGGNGRQESEKSDLVKYVCELASGLLSPIAVLKISAKKGARIEKLKEILINSQQNISVESDTTLVTNVRHYQALLATEGALDRVREGLESGLSTELVAQDIREAIYNLGTIVGEISADEILGEIFGRFCIGK